LVLFHNQEPHVIYAIGKHGAKSAVADKYLACGFTAGFMSSEYPNRPGVARNFHPKETRYSTLSFEVPPMQESSCKCSDFLNGTTQVLGRRI
jgi:hypothetical protein